VKVMAGFIPENILDDVQSANDIVEIVSGYIPLKRAGKDYKALCPFHNEKTPSFMISPQKQIFHCFGCGVGGDVINFVMKYERIEFVEAVRMLSERAGIILPAFEKTDKAVSKKEKIYALNAFAAEIYNRLLFKEKNADIGRRYIKDRGLSSGTCEQFLVGYAPNSWDFMLSSAHKAGYSDRELFDAGLIIEKQGKSGTFYDRFRDRIVFPVWNTQNKITGFSARVLDGSLPKYVNTPDTIVYNKSKLLYGLNAAKDAVIEQGYIVVCEGHVDFLTLFQAGIKNVCASQGTAFTSFHARLFKRYTDKVIVSFDSDSAGESATLRSCEIFIEEGLSVKILVLPKGYDPDSYVKEHGAESFTELISQAHDLFDFKLEILMRKIDYSSLHGKSRIAENMFETIARLPSAISASECVKKLAEKLQISEEATWLEFRKKKTGKKASRETQEEKTVISVPPWERDYIALVMEDHRCLDAMGVIIAVSDFSNVHLRKILENIINLRNDNKLNYSTLTNSLEDQELKDMVSSLAFKHSNASADDKVSIFKDYLCNIKKRSIRGNMNSIVTKIAHAEREHADYSDLLRKMEKKKLELGNITREIALFCENYR